jgi:cytochrome b involved in lipid metabolism
MATALSPSAPEALRTLPVEDLRPQQAEASDGQQRQALTTGPLQQLDWAEVQKHNTRTSSWLVINDNVYDITNFGRRHPGGKVIYHYAGQDATDSFRALHPDPVLVTKYLKPLLIGQVAPSSSSPPTTAVAEGARPAPSAFVEEFRQMRKEFEGQGLFEANWFFFFGMLAHIFLLEAVAYLSIKLLGNSWPVYLFALALLTIAQAQAGWLQARHAPLTHAQAWPMGTISVHGPAACSSRRTSVNEWVCTRSSSVPTLCPCSMTVGI